MQGLGFKTQPPLQKKKEEISSSFSSSFGFGEGKMRL